MNCLCKIIVTCILAITGDIICVAQQSYNVKGRVTSAGDRIDGFSAVLLSAKDSTIIKGDFFMSDEFLLETDTMPALLRISSFGYNDTILMVRTPEEYLNISLVPQSVSLEEVTVTAQRPVFTARPGRYTMNVSNDLLRQSGTAVNLLSKMARVRINEKQEITVLGVGNAVVWVDGRQLPDNRSLSSITSSEIQKIEVITNPSAKYDAEGKAVIEITTKGPQEKPWGVELTGRLAKGDYWRRYLGVETTAQIWRFSIYGFYAFNPQKDLFSEKYIRDYTRTPFPRIIDNNVNTVNDATNNNYRLSMDYRISDYHKAGLQVSGQYTDNDMSINDVNSVCTTAQDNPQMFYSDQYGKLQKEYTSVTFYHSYNSPSGKLSWNTLVDYSLYDTDKRLNIFETGISGQPDKKNEEATHIDIFSGRTDAQIRLPLDFQLEPGAKFTFSRNNSTTKFIVSDNERPSDYNYHEGVAAVYLLASKQFSRFRAQAGLRMELSDMYAKTDGEVIQDKRQADLFPSASFDWQFHHDWSLNASYAKKITRPTFQDLNPAITYVDELSYSKGNPLLVPEIRNAFDLKLVYKGFASLGVSYTRAKNSFGWQVLQDEANPDVTCATQINVNRSDSYTVDLMLPYQNKHLTAYLSTGLIYSTTHDSRLEDIDLKRPMWYCYSGLDLNLPWNLKLNTNIGYYTKGVVNVFTAEPMFRMDAGLSRRFLGDNLNVSLSWNDIFHSAKTSSYSMMSNRYLHYSFYNDQSFVQLSVSFSLNGIKNPFKSRSGIDEDRERIKGL